MIFKKKEETAEKFLKQAEKSKGTDNSDKKTATSQTHKTNIKSKWNSRCGDLLPH